MKLKEKIENSAIFIFAGIAVAAYMSGIATQAYFTKNSGEYLSKDRVEQEYIRKVSDRSTADTGTTQPVDYCSQIDQLKSTATALVQLAEEQAGGDQRKAAIAQTLKEEVNWILGTYAKRCKRLGPEDLSELNAALSVAFSKNGIQLSTKHQ